LKGPPYSIVKGRVKGRKEEKGRNIVERTKDRKGWKNTRINIFLAAALLWMVCPNLC